METIRTIGYQILRNQDPELLAEEVNLMLDFEPLGGPFVAPAFDGQGFAWSPGDGRRLGLEWCQAMVRKKDICCNSRGQVKDLTPPQTAR